MSVRAISIFACGITAAACANVARPGAKPTDAGADTPAQGSDTMPLERACVNLQCQQVSCANGETSVSGTVFAPNGKLPLFNVIIYVPNAPLDPFPDGVTCDRCGTVASGNPIASAVSDSEGKFKIKNVPVGANIPLVFQVGKWRRKITIPSVMACKDHPIADANLTRLPRNRQEGDLPRIAVTTGVCDNLACLLPKLGVDPAEFGVTGENKAVTYFWPSPTPPLMGVPARPDPRLFGPPNMRNASELWDDEAQLSKYDLTVLSCECSENPDAKSAAAFAAMTNYLKKGGRVFGSHFSYVWFKNTTDPTLSRAAQFSATLDEGTSPMAIDTSFPKGKAMADWMKFVDPAVTYGQIVSREVFANVRATMAPTTLVWASSPTIAAGTVTGTHPRIITTNTPAGVTPDKQCGRIADLDAHITPTDDATAAPSAAFPQYCEANLSKGEEALAFLLFDLSSCIQDDKTPVAPPIIVP